MEKGQTLYQEMETDGRQTLQPELMSIMKEEIGKAKEGRMPIIRAFEAVAKRSGLKANTIRNYYYRYIHAHEDNKATDDNKKVEDSDVVFTSDAIGRPFTSEETKKLMREMLIAQGRNESVRGCANRLSGGDKRVLIRLQNKYRSIIARESEYVREIIKELEEEGKVCFNPYTRRRIRGISSNVYKSNTSYTSNYESKYHPDRTNGQLLDAMGQFVGNMKSINISSLNDLVTGLRDLSNLAAGNASGVDYMNRYDRKIRDLSNEVTLLNAVISRDREQLSRLDNQHKAITNACKSFLSLSDTDKLAHLNDFVNDLQTCLVD